MRQRNFTKVRILNDDPKIAYIVKDNKSYIIYTLYRMHVLLLDVTNQDRPCLLLKHTVYDTSTEIDNLILKIIYCEDISDVAETFIDMKSALNTVSTEVPEEILETIKYVLVLIDE